MASSDNPFDIAGRHILVTGGSSGFGRHFASMLAAKGAKVTLAARRIEALAEAVLQIEAAGGTARSVVLDVTKADSITGARYLYEVYLAADPAYTGRVTIPILWDKIEGSIVNNESSEIIRILNAAFDGVGALPGDYYPQHLRPEIDAVNVRIYETLNNGVYRAGFATTQAAYEEAVFPLFETLDWLEHRLEGRQWLVGEQLTEADIRLFTTLVRFDAVYHGHFKCNLRRIADYPHLSRLTRAMASDVRIAPTINLPHAKAHYYGSHLSVNPTGVIPVGPAEPIGPAIR